MQGEKNSRKSKQRNKCRKKIIGKKKLKIKLTQGKKDENSTKLQNPMREAEDYDNNKKMWLRGKKKLKSLIGFLMPVKPKTTREGERREKKEKK